MTSDDVIEAAARALLSGWGEPTWDKASELVRQGCLDEARTLAKAGLLVDELPIEPLPVGQVRVDPELGVAHQKTHSGQWCAWDEIASFTDDFVRDWAVLVPEANLDDLSAERDRLAARVAELEAAEGCAVDAGAIREHLPAARREALPAGYVAIDLRDVPSVRLGSWTTVPGRTTSLARAVLSRVADAELARRAEKAGEGA